MVVNPNPITAQLHTSIQSVTLSYLPSGNTIGRTTVNNFRSKSQIFQQMNYYIQMLDEAFHMLAP